MEPGESQSHLRLDADDSKHREITGARDDVVQERGLAYARFTAQHDCTGVSGPGRVENAVDCRSFRAATEKHVPTVANRTPSKARRQPSPGGPGNYTFSRIRAATRSFMLLGTSIDDKAL